MCYWARSWDCNCKFILSICAFPLVAESRYNLCSSSFLVPEFCIIYCTGWEFLWPIHTPAYPGKMVVGKYKSKFPCVEDTMHRLNIRCDSVISSRPNGHPQWSGIHSTVFLLAPLPPQTVFWFLGANWSSVSKKTLHEGPTSKPELKSLQRSTVTHWSNCSISGNFRWVTKVLSFPQENMSWQKKVYLQSRWQVALLAEKPDENVSSVISFTNVYQNKERRETLRMKVSS